MISELKEMLEQERESTDDIMERISFAVGSAVFDREKDHSYQEVFERADKKMYTEKQAIHARDGYTGSRSTIK